MTDICPCCGQIIAPDLRLSPTQQRLYDALKRRPRNSQELRDIAWRDDPNGGPLDTRVIYTHIGDLNRKLKPHGIAARRPGGVQYEPYRLVPL